MRNDGGHIVGFGEFNGIQSFGQSADLIDFYQNRIRRANINSFLQKARVRNKQIITDELNFFADLLGDFFPAVPIRFR